MIPFHEAQFLVIETFISKGVLISERQVTMILMFVSIVKITVYIATINVKAFLAEYCKIYVKTLASTRNEIFLI